MHYREKREEVVRARGKKEMLLRKKRRRNGNGKLKTTELLSCTLSVKNELANAKLVLRQPQRLKEPPPLKCRATAV